MHSHDSSCIFFVRYSQITKRTLWSFLLLAGIEMGYRMHMPPKGGRHMREFCFAILAARAYVGTTGKNTPVECF